MDWTQEVYCLVSLDHRHTGAPLTYSFEMKKKVIWGWISGRKLKTRGNKPWEWNSQSSPFPAGIEIHLGFIFIKASQFLQVGQECKKCLLSPLRVALSDSTKVTNCLGTQKTKFPRKHPQGLGETQFLPLWWILWSFRGHSPTGRAEILGSNKSRPFVLKPTPPQRSRAYLCRHPSDTPIPSPQSPLLHHRPWLYHQTLPPPPFFFCFQEGSKPGDWLHCWRLVLCTIQLPFQLGYINISHSGLFSKPVGS